MLLQAGHVCIVEPVEDPGRRLFVTARKGQQFKYRKKRYRIDNAALIAALSAERGATLAEYQRDREKLLPNGRLTLRELRRIVEIVRSTEQASAYDFLDDVIEAVLAEVGEVAMEVRPLGSYPQAVV